MTGNPSNQRAEDESDHATDEVERTATSSTYKILGELADPDGTGILGTNTASSGTPIGVKGTAPNASGGYGLSTPDDLRVGDTAELTSVATRDSDFALTTARYETDEAGNIILGHTRNTATSGTVGGVIGGGGSDPNGNTVSNKYSTVGGGEGNTARYRGAVGGGWKNTAGAPVVSWPPDVREGDSRYTTVGGGDRNTARGPWATIGGGRENETDAPTATISGGDNNSTDGEGDVVAGGKNNATATTSDIIAYVATVSGGEDNSAFGHYVTIGGGKSNTAAYSGSTVGGGRDNQIVAPYGATAGGESNRVDGAHGLVGGGFENTATSGAVVAGGTSNTATGFRATIGGGTSNDASGRGAIVSGGRNNTASGDYSVAAGRKAATSGHEGAFVVGDATSTAVYGQGPNEARFQMPVYAPSHNTTSARSEKIDIEPVDASEVLAGVRSLSVSTWEFTDTDDGRHMGPMAGEFQATFELGDDDETIASVDADGVALAAIQALAERLDEKTDRIDALEAEADRKADRIEELERATERIDEFEADNEQLREALARKEDRIDTLEARLGAIETRLGDASVTADD
jgi:hypothetical protein